MVNLPTVLPLGAVGTSSNLVPLRISSPCIGILAANLFRLFPHLVDLLLARHCYSSLSWHSTLQFEKVSGGHEIHIEFSNTGLPANALAGWFPASQTIRVRTDPGGDGWAWDDGVGAPHKYDFASTILHEVGHVVGFDHFGSYAAMQIMTEQDQPFRDDHLAGPHNPGDPPAYIAGSGTLRTIDGDAVHGSKDLYAIAVPEPATLSLLLAAILGAPPAGHTTPRDQYGFAGSRIRDRIL